MNFKILLSTTSLLLATSALAQTTGIALLKYNGGGDWYANPTSLTNLIQFCNKNLNTSLKPDYATVEVGSADLFNYPLVHLTGHGNIVFSDKEVANLRNYLIGGGFLHVDDNYGLDPFIRREMERVFPEIKPVELSASHPIFNQYACFPNGLPKVHEHDNKRPQAFAWIYNGRMVCFYTYECDLGDGWEDQEVHGDSQATRLKALQMGANIVQFAFAQ
ncbi:MAG: DUF4159 domain-containing protein [Bacteroidales bacterium]|jgi:hypothetical protein|nr:DUF4159 domain-containing protein [Bacteroidales bacterium]